MSTTQAVDRAFFERDPGRVGLHVSLDDTRLLELEEARLSGLGRSIRRSDVSRRSRDGTMRPEVLRRTQVMADAVTVAVGAITTLSVPTQLDAQLDADWKRAAAVIGAVVGWLVAMSAARLYVARVVERPSDEIRRILLASSAVVSVGVVSALLAGAPPTSRGSVATGFAIVSTLLVMERTVARRVFHRLRASGRAVRRIAVIGTDLDALKLVDAVTAKPELGYHIVGFIGDDVHARRQGRATLGPIARARDVLLDHRCSGALISLSSVAAIDVNRLTRDLTDGGFHVALSTGLRDIDVSRMRPQGLDGRNLIYVEPTIRTGWRSLAKRSFDLVVATCGLIVSAPFVCVAAVLIKLESDGPVFFRQERVGRDGEIFQMMKLRSMYQDAEQRKAELMAANESDGPLFKIRNDPRITRVGRFLRKLSIDELPQFWNVVRGDMSIVGPRPALPSEATGWDEELHERLRVLPGITGMWQVSGRSNAGFEAYKRLDLYYVDNWSLWHDVQIVMRTFVVLLTGRGAS
jgi:exopolysaccharide biosynthesis polyprenyl glycosylphosphotransferase